MSSPVATWPRRIALVLVPAVVAGLVALVLSLVSTDRYESSALVSVDPNVVSIDTALEVAQGFTVVNSVSTVAGDGFELSVEPAGGDDLLRFTASSSDPGTAGFAATVYAVNFTQALPGTTLIDEAPPADEPTGLSTLQVVVGAVLIGALVGVLAVAFLMWRDPKIHRAKQLTNLTGVPNLAVIPRPPLGIRRPYEVAMLRDPRSIEAEAYRTLLAGVDVLAREQDATVLLITSPRPGEGKSSVAANLAAAAAASGRRVVLIDADMRKPNVHRDYQIANEFGLSSVLAGAASVPMAISRLPSEPNLAVMPAGPPPPEPTELLTNERLARTIEALDDAADLVIVDSPPLLPVADTLILAQASDAVLLAATSDVSDRREIAETLSRLAVVNVPVLGTVLSQPDDRIEPVYGYRYAPSARPDNWWVAKNERELAPAAAEPTEAIPAPTNPDEAAQSDASDTAADSHPDATDDDVDTNDDSAANEDGDGESTDAEPGVSPPQADEEADGEPSSQQLFVVPSDDSDEGPSDDNGNSGDDADASDDASTEPPAADAADGLKWLEQ